MKYADFVAAQKIARSKPVAPNTRVVLRILSRAEFKRLGLSLPSFRLFFFLFTEGFIVVLPFFDFLKRPLSGAVFSIFKPFHVVSCTLSPKILSPSSFRLSAAAETAPHHHFSLHRKAAALLRNLILGCWVSPRKLRVSFP